MQINDKEIRVSGKVIKTAFLEEEWYEDVNDPEEFAKKLKKSGLKADIFTFWQRIPETNPKYSYYREFENLAVLKIESYDHWWEKQIKSRTRGLVRKGKKKGLVIKEAKFDDEFVRGMVDIFNESPMRQGKPFWHYGKSFDEIKRDFAKYLFREDIIGAYYNDKLVGFIFLAYAGNYALPAQILSKIEHRDKAPNNALIAKAVEICEKKKIPYFVYFYWGDGTLAEFKRRNGFEKIVLPRYYIPLTIKGKVILKLGLHRGITGILPQKVLHSLKNLRSRIYLLKYS